MLLCDAVNFAAAMSTTKSASVWQITSDCHRVIMDRLNTWVREHWLLSHCARSQAGCTPILGRFTLEMACRDMRY